MEQTREILSLSQNLNIPYIVAEVLFKRGYKTEQEIVRFYDAESQPLLDPFLLKNMRHACDRIRQAIDNGEKVVIYGDYDADGICSAVMLYLYLLHEGLYPSIYIPSRQNEGYGLHNEAIEFIAEEYSPDLIITCDCGVSAVNEVNYILELGMDVIVTDHHELPPVLPECTIINCKLDGYPFPDLCGAGVVLKVIEAMSGNAEEYLDICAIATVADLVPLVGENRAIVARGLTAINQKNRLGLRLLLESLNITEATSTDISFKIAPMINAAGRMGDATRALDLFLCMDAAVLKEVIQRLKQDNEERRALCEKIYLDALEMLKSYDMTSRAIILYNKAWEKGITGIVCARLSKDFNRPTILITGEQSCKATVRGIPKVNVFELLSAHADYFIEFGGHSQAAGFSIYQEDIAEFTKKANAYLLENYDGSAFMPEHNYDVEIDCNQLTLDLAKEINRLEPFGHGNPRPVFLISAECLDVAEMKNREHLTITLDGGAVIPAFNSLRLKELFKSAAKKALCVELDIGYYKGESVKLRLLGVDCKRLLPDEDLVLCQALSEYAYGDAEVNYTTYSSLDEVLSGCGIHGTLVIASDYQDYLSFIDRHEGFLHTYFSDCSLNNCNKIVLAPKADIFTQFFNRIVFLSPPKSTGYIKLFAGNNAKIFLPEREGKPLKIDCSRETLLKYYSIIKSSAHIHAEDFYAYAEILKAKYGTSFSGLMLAVLIFNQLKIVKITKKPYNIMINSTKKTNLEDSPLYLKLSGK